MKGLLRIPAGWEVSDPFDLQSVITSVTAGAGVGSTAAIVVASGIIPPNARVLVERLSFRVVTVPGADQLSFALRHKGYKVLPWDKISGEQIVDEHMVDVGRTFEGGLIEIAATNIGGTSETGAGEAVDLRVIARLYGYLLRKL